MRYWWLAATSVGAVLLLGPHAASAGWPSLDDVAKRAHHYAPTLAEARGQVSAAKGLLEGARAPALQNPYVEVFTDRGRETKDLAVQANFWIPIELAGQRGARIDEAQRMIQWRSVNLLDAQSRSLGEAVVAYGDVLILSARLEQAKRGESEAKAEVDFYAGRLAVGDTTIYEKSIAEAELGRWVQARVEMEVALVQARARLEQVTGFTDVTPPPTIAAAPPALRTPYSINHRATADHRNWIERLPAIAALNSEEHFWLSSADRARAERSVPINFIVSLGRGDAGETRVGGGLSWTFPLLQRNHGPITRAHAERARVAEVRFCLVRVLESRVRSLYETLQAAQKAVDAIDTTSIPAAERVVAAAAEGHRAGKVEALKVFIARRDLATSRGRRLDLVATAWRTYGKIAALRGELP